MVSPAFGWSAGDIVQSIKIINEIYDAFKESGRASNKYADSIAFLEGFKSVLNHIKDYANDSSTAKYTEAINEQVKLIDVSYIQFEKHMLSFYPALGATSTQSGIRKAPKRIKWALKELSDVSGKVAELKKAVADPVVLIEPLLQLQSVDTIGAIATQISKLPDVSQFNMLKSVLTDTAVATVAEFQEHICDLKKAADHQGEQMTVQLKSLVSLTKCLSQKEIVTRSIVSEENEKKQQQRIVESTKMMAHIDEVTLALQEKLDTIIATLADRGGLQLRSLEELEKRLKTQQVTLNHVQDVVEGSFAKAVDMINIMEITRKEAKDLDSERMKRTESWLRQFAIQLLASGITSAMTGAVVFVATRSKSTSSEKSNDHDGGSREQSSTGVSLAQSTDAKFLGPNEEPISKTVEKTHSRPEGIEGRTIISPHSSQPRPESKQYGGASSGLNVHKNEISAFKNADNKPPSVSRETARAETGRSTRLKSSLSFAAKGHAQTTQADSNEDFLTGPQSASSRSNLRTSIDVSRQSPANQLFMVRGLEDDRCAYESPSVRSQTSTSGPGTSALVQSIQNTSSKTPSGSKQQSTSKKPDNIFYPTSRLDDSISTTDNHASMPSSQRNTSSALDQYPRNLRSTADHQGSISDHSDYVFQSSPNNKAISSPLTQNYTSKGSNMVNNPPSVTRGDFWICCCCLQTNISAISLERCSVCGHVRCSCC